MQLEFFYELAVHRPSTDCDFTSLQAFRHELGPEGEPQDHAALLQVEPTGQVLYERQICQGTCSRRNSRF
jgi:hypothetical protein